MNPILEEIYSTIIPSAPYLIAAYVLIMVILFVFIFIIRKGLKKAEREMEALEEEFAERSKQESHAS